MTGLGLAQARKFDFHGALCIDHALLHGREVPHAAADGDHAPATAGLHRGVQHRDIAFGREVIDMAPAGRLLGEGIAQHRFDLGTTLGRYQFEPGFAD